MQPRARNPSNWLGLFYTLGHRVEVEGLAQLDDDLARAAALAESPTSSTKDLSTFKMSIGEPLEVTERRVTGTEVVDCKCDAELFQLEHPGNHRFCVLDQYALGDLEHQARRVEPRNLQAVDTSSIRPSCWKCRAEMFTLIRSLPARA